MAEAEQQWAFEGSGGFQGQISKYGASPYCRRFSPQFLGGSMKEN
jgi:hypothetical protein